MRRSLFAQQCPPTEYTHSRYTDYNRNRSNNISEYNADPEPDRRGQIRIQIHDIIKNSNLSARQRNWSIFRFYEK